jgi:pimeloyl-ACP methyl ester carboxylesterase
VTHTYAEKVLRPLCIKGSYDGLLYILRDVLIAPYVEKEANTLAQMDMPILLVHGREDAAVPLDRSEALHVLWKGSKLEIFEKAGHTPHEAYPEKFNELATAFLSE